MKLSGSPLSPVQPRMTEPSRFTSVDFLRYSPHSKETISALTPTFAKSDWISSAVRRAFGM
ncbi:hypothetical protein D3C78_1728000 [compost metagenome]